MTAPLALTGLEEAARTVQSHLDRGQRRVTLYGRASSGKTSAMKLLARQLHDSGWSVYRTQMTGDDDGAPVALATLASCMARDAANAVLDVRVPWNQKVRLVLDALSGKDRKTAVLVDDPWLGTPDEVPSMFAERSVNLLDEIERSARVALVLSRSDRPLAGTFVELPTAPIHAPCSPRIDGRRPPSGTSRSSSRTLAIPSWRGCRPSRFGSPSPSPP